MNKNDDKRRFLIVGTGRNGSSLLAAILADAGAEFDMAGVESWDRSAGAYEHPLVHSATAWNSRGQKAERFRLPVRRFFKARETRDLRKLLEAARFVKSSYLVWMVQPIYKLGYTPVIIIAYRRFETYARSYYLRSGRSLKNLADTYYDVCTTCLLQLQIFGGCTVDYDEVIDAGETAWAETLAAVTGLSAGQILAARAERVIPRDDKGDVELDIPDMRPQQLYETLRRFKGHLVKGAKVSYQR